MHFSNGREGYFWALPYKNGKFQQVPSTPASIAERGPTRAGMPTITGLHRLFPEGTELMIQGMDVMPAGYRHRSFRRLSRIGGRTGGSQRGFI